jgi:hypothetical protein
MSQLEVDKVIPQSGTTLTLGDSADTITIPSGATLDASNATLTLPDGSVTTAKIADSNITTAKLADANITTAKLAYDPNPFRNIVINGDMSLAQRSTSVASITVGGYYTVDRFQTFINGTIGTWTQSQSTDTPTGQGFATSLKMDCTTADAAPAAADFLIIQQSFEGQNLQYLKKGTANAVQLTASFWVKSTKTGTFICELLDVDNTRQVSASYTVSVTNTWEKKTITFPADTTGAFTNDNGESLRLNFWLAAGTDWTSGTLQTTWASTVSANRAVGQVNVADSDTNDWYITGVQLEAGTTASDFEFLPYDVNLGRCQRYLQFIDAEYFVVARWDSSAGNPLGQLNFLKTMRAAPTASAIGTFLTGAGYAGIPSFNNIQTVCLALGGADSISANAIRYLHGGVFEMESEL